jgi:DNA-nicking Smr family endonuclease
LWEAVTRSARPLRRPHRPRRAAAAETAKPVPAAASEPPAAPALRPGPRPRGAPPLAAIERRLIRRVVRGAADFDARLDLHGLTADAAHDRLSAFLAAAQARGHVLVLIVTGKGRGADGGILRRQVPLWLAMAPFRRLVVGSEEARLPHGGAGALYVRMRRRREA